MTQKTNEKIISLNLTFDEIIFWEKVFLQQLANPINHISAAEMAENAIKWRRFHYKHYKEGPYR